MKRLVIVGTGGRGSGSFAAPLLKEFKGRIEVAGMYDINPKRARAALTILEAEIPLFTDFDEMMRRVRPDGVIVTTMDCAHAEYIIKSLEQGCETFSEKPLCTTAHQVHAIRAAAARSKAKGYVTHNVRFVPDLEVMKRHLLDGSIGKPLHILFSETLDRYHGADYFRRWHRFMKNSAGLMVHKASHHFDVMNWLADSRPRVVTAQGGLFLYGKNGPFHGERCSNCAHARECPFYADVFASANLRTMYQEPEDVDGYFRDGCVFDPRIDIDDTVSASISYENGVVASYSLVSYGAYESMRIEVEGTLGRLELLHCYGTSWAVGHEKNGGQVSLANDGKDEQDRKHVLLYLPGEKAARDITAPPVAGGHDGSDPKLRSFLFGDAAGADSLNQKAPLEEGIQAVLVGLAANESIRQSGMPIHVQKL